MTAGESAGQEPLAPSRAVPNTLICSCLAQLTPWDLHLPPAPRPPRDRAQDYYLACGIGGILSCGITHTMVTPLDVVKCNMQVGAGATAATQRWGLVAFSYAFLGSLAGVGAR